MTILIYPFPCVSPCGPNGLADVTPERGERNSSIHLGCYMELIRTEQETIDWCCAEGNSRLPGEVKEGRSPGIARSEVHDPFP